MTSFSSTTVKTIAWVGAAMVVIVVFHIGGVFALRVGQFAPLTGAFIGGILAFGSAILPRGRQEKTEPWLGSEQLSWMLIGFGTIMWGIGDSFWRYYVSLGQNPFPSIADVGYTLFPLLAFSGLLLLPRPDTRTKRIILIMDCLISMGSILALAWYLLLGSLAQAPGEANLGKFLGLYYPSADTALISCVIFLLLRGQGRVYQSTARRASLLLVGLGLCFFVASDFVFNIQQNAGTYVEATWIDLGWPLGMMIIGVAAYVRRFLPATSEELIQERMEQGLEENSFNPPQFVPYGLLVLLFIALTLDVLTNDPGQQALRPVLLFATLGVVVLVVARQIFTIWENMRLTRRQAESLEELGIANQRIEEQARLIHAHNEELERGIEHLKDVQASISNGNLRVRATLTHGALLPLAGSLNLMAERLSRMGQASIYAQKLSKGLNDLGASFERYSAGAPFIIPESCRDLVEVNRLLVAMRMRGISPLRPASASASSTGQPLNSNSSPSIPAPHPVTQPMMQPVPRQPETQPLSPRGAVRSYPPTPMPFGEEPPRVNSNSKIVGLRRSASFGTSNSDEQRQGQ